MKLDWYKEIIAATNELLKSNEENRQYLGNEFDKGHFIGYHNAIVDLLNKLMIETDEEIYEMDECDE